MASTAVNSGWLHRFLAMSLGRAKLFRKSPATAPVHGTPSSQKYALSGPGPGASLQNFAPE